MRKILPASVYYNLETNKNMYDSAQLIPNAISTHHTNPNKGHPVQPAAQVRNKKHKKQTFTLALYVFDCSIHNFLRNEANRKLSLLFYFLNNLNQRPSKRSAV